MNLLEYVTTGQWAMERGTFSRLLDIVDRHATGVKLDAQALESAIGKGRNSQDMPEMVIQDGTAVIPIQGVIARHASAVSNISGPRGTSVSQIRSELRAAMADDDVDRIVFDVDTPGGSVDGIADLADEIAAASKPTTAVVESMMASAGVWLMSGVDRIVAGQTARVGSVGVVAVMTDTSHRDHDAGITRTVVTSGRAKGGGMGGKVSSDHVANRMEIVDTLAGIFFDTMEARRGLDTEQMAAIREGGLFVAEEARRHGLVDEIGSMDGVMAQWTGKSRARAEDVEVIITATATTEEAPMSEQPTADQIRAKEMERLEALRAALPADEALDAYTKGLSVTEAKALRCDKLQAELEATKEAMAQQTAKLEATKAAAAIGNEPVGHGTPPEVEASCQERFQALVDQYKATGAKQMDATSQAIRSNPDLYQQYLSEVNGFHVAWPPKSFSSKN
jgi:ClpP class serine protease